MPREHRIIARVVKPHGRRGKVVAVPADGLPALLREGLDVCVVPPALKGDRWHRVLSVEDGAAGQLVGLSGVEDLGAAEDLVGTYLLADVSELPDDLSAHDANNLMGRSVVDAAAGDVGSIVDVMYGPANDVWVVEGRYGEVLVPVVDEIVGQVTSEGPIAVVLPQGLVPDARDGEVR